MGNAFRLSKCEWQETEFGKAPAHWEIETIGALSEKVTDGSHFSPKPRSAGKYMCSVKDMTYNRFDFSNCKLISQNDFDKLVVQGCKPEKNDILISKDGANCLDLIFVFDQKEDLVLLSSIAIVRLLPNIDPEFVCYFLLSPACQYIMRNNFVSGSAIPRVVIKDFKKVSIVLPPLPEQKAIASVLSSLDDKIDLLHRQNKTLEAMAETLFRQWFVVEAQEDWEEKRLVDILTTIESGSRPKGGIDPNLNHGIPSIGAENINGLGNYNFRSTKYVTSEYFEKMKRGIVQDYDVLIYKDGAYIGKKSMFAKGFPFKKCAINEHVFILRTKSIFLQLFLYFALEQEELALLNANSAQPGLNQTTMKSFEILLPNSELIEMFSQTIMPLIDKIFFNGNQIRILEKLRDTLLPKLMNGEVCIEYEN